MPNWCAGTLRVRGKVKDLKRFVTEGLTPVGLFGQQIAKLEFDEFNCVWINESCHIENTRRGFVRNLDVEIYEEDENEIFTILLDTEFAWGINAEELQKTCEKYSVDMRIYAFERGTEFNQEIEIIDGEILKDNEIKFTDYRWECICPTTGG